MDASYSSRRGRSRIRKSLATLYLVVAKSKAGETCAWFALSVLNANNELKSGCEVDKPLPFKAGKGRWLPLFNKGNMVCLDQDFPGGQVIVRCDVFYSVEKDTEVLNECTFLPRDPSADFRQLLENGMSPDIVFEVNGKEFHAHKAILAARSPTLKKIFELISTSTQASRLEIRDADDQTFSESLRFMYTGETNKAYEQIQDMINMIASQVRVTLGAKSSDGKNAKQKHAADEIHARECNVALSSAPEETRSGAKSTLPSVPASLRSFLGEESTKTTSKSCLGLELSPSETIAAIAELICATRLRSPVEESSNPALDEEKVADVLEVVGRTLSENTHEISPQEKLESCRISRLQQSRSAERVPRHPLASKLGRSDAHPDECPSSSLSSPDSSQSTDDIVGHLRKSSDRGSLSPKSTFGERMEVVKRVASPKARYEKAYPCIKCDLTQLKSIIPNRTPGKTIHTMIEFFNGQEGDSAEEKGGFVALKRSLSTTSIGRPHLRPTTRKEIGSRSENSGRLRRVCSSAVDLTHVEDDEVPLTDESPDYGCDHGKVSADEQEVGCAIPDVKGLINMFPEGMQSEF